MLHIIARVRAGGGASLKLKRKTKIDTQKADLVVVFIMSISVIKLTAYALKHQGLIQDFFYWGGGGGYASRE